MPKSRNWIRLRKKTEPELPYRPPFWFGDYSNGELYHEATPRERTMQKLILEQGAEQAKRHGMERREFMASGLGVALSMSVMNLVNGCDGGRSGGFSLHGNHDEGTGEPLPQEERTPMPSDLDPEECETLLEHPDKFIFDIQTHRVENAPGIYRAFLSILPQGLCGKGVPACYSKDEYVRELFLESDTTMTLLSGIPAVDGQNPLTNEQIAETRDYVNGIAAGTQRVVTHAMVLPNYKHEEQLAGMERIVKERAPVAAWKCYTPWGPGNGVTGFWLDDPKTGIPFIEKGRELDVKVFCCHKGLPLPGFDNSYGDPKDIGVVAKRYPDCKFVVYHSAYQFGQGDENTPYRDGARSGVSSLVTAVRANGIEPGGNVYGELGTTWYNVMNDPRRATHVLGKLLKYLGEDNVVWGTDSMWYGSPQPQILAFLNFKMDQRIREQEGYPDLTPQIKTKILGLNAAKVFGVDPGANRCGIERSEIARAKHELDDEFGKYRWALQEPVLKTRRDFLLHTAHNRANNRPG